MKTRGSKVGGIIMIVLGATMAALFIGIAVSNAYTLFDTPASSGWPVDHYGSSNGGVDMMKGALVFGMFFLAMCCVPVIILGVITLNRGRVNQKVAKEGKPSTCVIEDLRCHHFRHGGWTYQLIVSYKDDNGNHQRYSTQISRYDYEDLKRGMKLECLVAGEECYIDINNIKVVEDQIDY